MRRLRDVSVGFSRPWRLLPGLFLLLLLAIPAPLAAAPCDYIVQRGDTLSRIAARNGTTVAAILGANPAIADPDVIHSGQRLRLPDCPAPAIPAPHQPPMAVIIRESPPRPLPAPPPDLPDPLEQTVQAATINVRTPLDGARYLSGSGVVVGSDGRTFLTAYHVLHNSLIRDEVERVAIGPFGAWRFSAGVVAIDPAIDLAVLRVLEPDFPGFAVAPLGRSSSLEEGDAIYTFSYPGGDGALVAGKGHYLTEVRSSGYNAPLIVTDAAANFGSSGGVAVNERGEVIGIITGGILAPRSLRALGYPGLSGATLIVPIDAATGLLKQAGVSG